MEELLRYFKDLRLLYVEDNEEARKYTMEMLTRLFKDITVAQNGEDGLQKFQEGVFDLVITDINMPVMNGIDMASHIKRIDSETPILVLSAHNETHYHELANAMKIDGYLSKPLTLQQTIDSLARLFEKGQ